LVAMMGAFEDALKSPIIDKKYKYCQFIKIKKQL